MINLLPTELKQQYVYARRNSRLRNWTVALFVGLIGVGIVTTAGMVYLQKSIDNFASQVSSTQKTLKSQQLGQTRMEAQDITSSLKLVVQVLSREVLFSKLLNQIATVTPENVRLTDLSINQVQGAIDIKAKSSDYASATQLQVNLQDPKNRIFSKADIQNIDCGGATDGGDSAYPCDISIKALFASDNPFLFIHKDGNAK